jgi:hypothetical protein
MQKIATVSKGAASVHGRVPCHLLHSLLGRMVGDPDKVNPAALEMDEEEHVIDHQTPPREDFNREEIGAGQHCKVSPNEFCPGRRSPALRCRRYAMTAENVADRLIGGTIPKRSNNPIIALGSIFLGHPHNWPGKSTDQARRRLLRSRRGQRSRGVIPGAAWLMTP